MNKWCITPTGSFYKSKNAPVSSKIPPGVYVPDADQVLGYMLTPMPLNTDNLMIFPDDPGEDIIKEFERFWTLKDNFTKRGFLHKRGFLLYGPPGSGKTSTVQLIIKKVVENLKGIVLFGNHPGHVTRVLQLVREIEPNRPIIVILEDLDCLIDDYGEPAYLALLDGEHQVDNVVYLATTNYMDRLNPRVKNRPSRFDTVQYIGRPNAKARAMYLKIKEPSLSSEELKDWVISTKGFSIAHLKEVIVGVKCFEQPLSKVVKRMKKMIDMDFDEESKDNGDCLQEWIAETDYDAGVAA